MAAETPLKIVLNEMIRVEGIRAVLVVSKDGFLIDYVSQMGKEIDPESVAAMVVSVYGALQRFAEEFNLGEMDMATAEYSRNMMLLTDIGDAMVVVITDRTALLGRIRYELKKQKDRLKAALAA
ncbi:roadblock/LC7 domain-containing protein [Ignicoccus hospitalis]|uniref:Roadblock/LC7 family protein n=1 Tax=Ignicoccus hospitalis (strain KIN4/I / DSM 18386 / JCM 14125) TaxID=453591 RepID=A8AB07_IGNH4|nr:roadblock/LC7 domain-containing protein [Ignicoccus hospitalis]ABU82109.1 Roadblock/LC7 family protein [Ignicoccus hospitalis KIN4/I]